MDSVTAVMDRVEDMKRLYTGYKETKNKAILDAIWGLISINIKQLGITDKEITYNHVASTFKYLYNDSSQKELKAAIKRCDI